MEIYPIPAGGMEVQSLGTLLRNQSAQNNNGDQNQFTTGENQGQSVPPQQGGSTGSGELLNCIA